MLEVSNVFVNVASFHSEGEDIPPCKVFAHVILECFSEVIDNRGPDPFIGFSSPKCHMLGNQLTGILDPCFNTGSADISQK